MPTKQSGYAAVIDAIFVIDRSRRRHPQFGLCPVVGLGRGRRQRLDVDSHDVHVRQTPLDGIELGILLLNEPGYLSDALHAIESVTVGIGKFIKRARIDKPEFDPADLAAATAKPLRRGVGEKKCEEVCFLILSDLRHSEVVRLERHPERRWAGALGENSAPPEPRN
jgi:hypothetical protein